MREVRGRAPWRHPALAPVYAAVVAFVAVLAAGVLIGPEAQRFLEPPTQTTVIVHAPPDGVVRVEIQGGQRLDGALVTVRDTDRTLATRPLDLVDGLRLPTPEDAEICLVPPPGWVVAEPACRPADGDLTFRLARS